jgi:hypothetical protein
LQNTTLASGKHIFIKTLNGRFFYLAVDFFLIREPLNSDLENSTGLILRFHAYKADKRGGRNIMPMAHKVLMAHVIIILLSFEFLGTYDSKLHLRCSLVQI